MAIGKLYKSNNDKFAVDVFYRFIDGTPESWWGELILLECRHLKDDTGYVLELDDERKGTCYLIRRFNGASRETAPCYIYDFFGTSSLLAPVASSTA